MTHVNIVTAPLFNHYNSKCTNPNSHPSFDVMMIDTELRHGSHQCSWRS